MNILIASVVLFVLGLWVLLILAHYAELTHRRAILRDAAEVAQRLADDAWGWYEIAQARHDRDQTERSRVIMEKAGANYRSQARYLDDCRKAAFEVGVEC